MQYPHPPSPPTGKAPLVVVTDAPRIVMNRGAQYPIHPGHDCVRSIVEAVGVPQHKHSEVIFRHMLQQKATTALDSMLGIGEPDPSIVVARVFLLGRAVSRRQWAVIGSTEHRDGRVVRYTIDGVLPEPFEWDLIDVVYKDGSVDRTKVDRIVASFMRLDITYTLQSEMNFDFLLLAMALPDTARCYRDAVEHSKRTREECHESFRKMHKVLDSMHTLASSPRTKVETATALYHKTLSQTRDPLRLLVVGAAIHTWLYPSVMDETGKGGVDAPPPEGEP